MNQLVEYTTKNLYGEFKPEEICFIVAKEDGLDYVDGLSYSTDDLDDALDEAKENDYKIFVYSKKLAIECLDTDLLYNDMIENVQEEGFDIETMIYDIKEDASEEFSTLLKTWFTKYFDNTYWIPDRLLGTLRLD
jgi:hypothetical protein